MGNRKLLEKRFRLRVGFACSAFDLLHAGHVLMLEDAKKHCDYLIVGLHTDPSLDRDWKREPFQSIIERQIQLKAIKYVDEIVVYQTEADLLELLKTRNIDIVILGSDYIGKDFTGKELHESRGAEVYYHTRTHDYSSTALVEKIQTRQPKGG